MKIKWSTLALWTALMANIIGKWEWIKSYYPNPRWYHGLFAFVFSLFMTLALVSSFGLLPELLNIFGIHIDTH